MSESDFFFSVSVRFPYVFPLLSYLFNVNVSVCFPSTFRFFPDFFIQICSEKDRAIGKGGRERRFSEDEEGKGYSRIKRGRKKERRS